jgi:hypothetical protein
VTEQLQLNLGHEPVEDDLSDLDLEHAERALAQERARRPLTARPCRCLRRGANWTINADGELICLKCGRRW